MLPDDTFSKKSKMRFEDITIDYAPLEKSWFGKQEEKLFGMMAGKKKVVPPKQEPLNTCQSAIISSAPIIPNIQIPTQSIPNGYTVQNGLLMKKKTLPERVRDQLRFPSINKFDSIVSGLALVVFAVGAYILYSELPTRPELVVGILLVTIAGNVIVSRR